MTLYVCGLLFLKKEKLKAVLEVIRKIDAHQMQSVACSVVGGRYIRPGGNAVTFHPVD